MKEGKHVCINLWESTTHWLATLISFIKIFFIVVCVTLIDKFAIQLHEMKTNNCSDPISNSSFNSIGSGLLKARSDNMVVFKITMLMLMFEVIGFLTPKIVHLRTYSKK
jgi:hypothetical protein